MTNKEQNEEAVPSEAPAEPEHPHRQMSAELQQKAEAPEGTGGPGEDRIRDLFLEEEDPGLTPLNWAIIGGGIVLLILGFFLLKQANAEATNWQAIWSPILILSSYLVIFIGILIVRKPPSEDAEA